VERVTVSGTKCVSKGERNHSWNWVKGLGDKEERERRESENCAACCAFSAESVGVVVVVVLLSPGATVHCFLAPFFPRGGKRSEESVLVDGFLHRLALI